MQTFTNKVEAATCPEAEDAATVVHFSYKQAVLASASSDGNIQWTVDGKPQLWLTTKDGRTVCLKDATATVNETGDSLVITIPNDEAARPTDVTGKQPE